MAGQKFAVIVDYAHTPESLASVLDTARELTTGRLIVVFGCGGDRDPDPPANHGQDRRGKADLVFITSDNPRVKSQERIIDEIVAGLPGDLDPGVWQRDADRASAIRAALLAARSGDVVLIAGKGHETYRILGDRTIHFDDREVAREVLTPSRPGGGCLRCRLNLPAGRDRTASRRPTTPRTPLPSWVGTSSGAIPAGSSSMARRLTAGMSSAASCSSRSRGNAPTGIST
ncbi:MAG: hypothetical protein MZU79_00885 [Anaerotruncus sp.]|nr:hypothetical protein [Anaerotruncus sp.]